MRISDLIRHGISAEPGLLEPAEPPDAGTWRRPICEGAGTGDNRSAAHGQCAAEQRRDQLELCGVERLNESDLKTDLLAFNLGNASIIRIPMTT